MFILIYSLVIKEKTKQLKDKLKMIAENLKMELKSVFLKITNKAIIIREEYRDFRGRKKFKDIPKKLPSLR